MSNYKPDITTVTAQHLCNTCGACFAACRPGAIRYEESVGGYLFPVVDATACNHCGVCYQVCPGVGLGKTLTERIAPDPFIGEIQSCHVGRATDEEIYRNSQSGGLATALLAHLFASGRIDAAIVAVMADGVPPRGEVRVIYQAQDLSPAQKSKYSPIPLLSALSQLPSEVERVGLVGVACQMHGLHNLQDLIPAYRKLQFYKIGLICDRTMTAAAIDYMGRLATSEPLVNLVWRDKLKPAYPGNPVVKIENGQEITLQAAQRMEIKDFFTPVRCRLCFDKLNVFADLTLGDPHGIKSVDRRGGESVVLVRTDIGRHLLTEASRQGVAKLREISPEEATNGQGIEQKRGQWAAAMQAWAEMGRVQPRFPLVPTRAASVAQQKRLLQYGLQLDSYASRTELLQCAESWVFRRQLIRAWRWPFSKIKGLLRHLKQG